MAITTASFLPNVTNLFNDGNDSGDCRPVLGEECTNVLLASGNGRDSCTFDFWEQIPECASTLGASRSYAEYGLGRLSFNLNSNGSAQNASYEDVGYAAVANGTDGRYAFVSQSTEAYNGTNTTVYETEATRLYVMLLSIAPANGQGGLWSQHALCMRANATQLPVKDDDGSGNSGGDGSPTTSDNLAPTIMPDKVASTLSLAGIGLGLYALL